MMMEPSNRVMHYKAFATVKVSPLIKKVITYYAVGARSAHIWFVLKYLLGYPNAKNYDGSWNEWSRLPGALIEK